MAPTELGRIQLRVSSLKKLREDLIDQQRSKYDQHEFARRTGGGTATQKGGGQDQVVEEVAEGEVGRWLPGVEGYAGRGPRAGPPRQVQEINERQMPLEAIVSEKGEVFEEPGWTASM